MVYDRKKEQDINLGILGDQQGSVGNENIRLGRTLAGRDPILAKNNVPHN